MGLSITWATKVINVLQGDLTFIGGSVYELDTDQFRKDLNALQASADGIVFETTHEHTAPKTLAGTTFARFIEIINGYTIDFEDGKYQVNLVGSNNNILDVKTVNQVSLAVQNTAGLIQVSTGSGLSAAQDAKLTAVDAQLSNIEGTYSHQEAMRLMLSTMVGKLLGAGTSTVDIYDTSGTKIRITASVDTHGNRTLVLMDET